MNVKDLPNVISVSRIVLIAPILWCLYQGYFSWAICLFVVAGITDALDGYLAKRFNCESRLGTILDPVADKLLLVFTMLMLAYLGFLPWWLFALVMARDVAISLVSIKYMLQMGSSFKITPPWISKVNTVMQIVLVILVLIDKGWFELYAGLLPFAFTAVAFSTALSGLFFLRLWFDISKLSAKLHDAE
ncbi:MAG: CDP-alcohol phosphatidyltransferase family protein [Gammaproteobacteria bacterium]|nr:CDP-alcohol phosphatidyltransferase family protein [Gammaproteobacteria bacterium]